MTLILTVCSVVLLCIILCLSTICQSCTHSRTVISIYRHAVENILNLKPLLVSLTQNKLLVSTIVPPYLKSIIIPKKLGLYFLTHLLNTQYLRTVSHLNLVISTLEASLKQGGSCLGPNANRHIGPVAKATGCQVLSRGSLQCSSWLLRDVSATKNTLAAYFSLRLKGKSNNI